MRPEEIRLPADRVTLRRSTKADAPALYDMFSNPEVMQYWSRPVMTDPVEAEKLLTDVLANYQSGEAAPLGIERNSDNVLVGNCTLFHFHEASRRAEIGYALGRPYWGCGFMHEALRALLTHAFGHLALHRLEADIDPRNSQSAKSLERLGFRKEGHLRERWIVNGEVSDTWFYGLLRGDWLNATRAGIDVIGIDHIYITVSDVTRSERFYDTLMGILGFRKNSFAIGGEPHIQYYNRHFGYVLRAGRVAREHNPYSPGLHHFCFRVESIQDVRAVASQLQAACIAATRPALHPGYAPDYWATFVTDPDGIRLEITNYRQERRDRHDQWGE